MRRDDDWADNIDLDRARATPRGIAGGWIVVAAIAVLMVVVPPSVCVADVVVAHARQKVEKIEHKLAQVLPRPPVECDPG